MTLRPSPVEFHPLAGLPLFEPGDDLATILGESLRASGTGLLDGDVLVVAQKIVSKVEGRYVELADVVPSIDAWLTLKPELSGSMVKIDNDRWRLIAAIGGGRSVGSVGEALGLDELPTLRGVKEIVELGLVAVSDHAPAEAAPERVSSLAAASPLVTEEPAAVVALQSTVPGAVNPARQFRSYGAITFRETTARSRYHGLLTSFRYGGGRAGTVDLNYTLSRNRTDASNDRDAIDIPQNPLDPDADYADARTDRRHIFTGSYVYEVPFDGGNAAVKL